MMSLLLFAMAMSLSLAAASDDDSSVKIWPETSLIRVNVWYDSQDPHSPFAGSNTLNLSMAGGESEGAQVVVNNPSKESALGNVTLDVTVPSLGGSSLSVEWSALGWIFPNGSKMIWQDAILEPSLPVGVPANQTRSWWLTVTTPYGAAPGLYRGSVSVSSVDRGHLATLDLVVTVYDVSVPVNTTFRTTYFSIWGVDNRFGPEWGDNVTRDAIAERVIEMYSKHRIFGNVYPLDWSYRMGCHPTEDMIESAMSGLWEKHGIPWELSLPCWEDKKEGEGGDEPGSQINWPRCNSPSRYGWWDKQAVERGMNIAVKVSDEPSMCDPNVKAAATNIHNQAPHIRAKSAFKTCPACYEDECYEGIMHEWGYQPRCFSSDDAMDQMVNWTRKHKEEGDLIYWYIHNFGHIGNSPVMYRAFFWMQFLHQLGGAMLYGTTQWGSDDNSWPFCEVKRINGVDFSIKGSGYVCPNMEGTILWPGISDDIPFLRFEIYRDGIEDYELVTLIRGMAEEYRKRFPKGNLAGKADHAIGTSGNGVYGVCQKDSDCNGYDTKLVTGAPPTFACKADPRQMLANRDQLLDIAVKLRHALGSS